MMNDLKQEATITFCLLEKEFPPSLFNIITHLMVHLVAEVKLCGPIHTQWMYPIESLVMTFFILQNKIL
jgi:hypothetical protein